MKTQNSKTKTIFILLFAISIVLASFIIIDLCNHTRYRITDDSKITTFIIKDTNEHAVFTIGRYSVYSEDGMYKDKHVSALYINGQIYHLISCRVDIIHDEIRITYTYDTDAYSNYSMPVYSKAQNVDTQTVVFDRTVYSYYVSYVSENVY